ncbi:hypothetical protein ACH4GP_24175 [Streptomyces celluloflavus]|uniref:Uncharacterized protein n=1 Tax=Streptomyces celluloflavus TaxID=58344 RepID=A0ABW7RHB2_9ACTN
MADVPVRAMERRVALVERAGRLREKLAETDAEVARPEAAEAVFGQFVEATDAGRPDGMVVAPGALTCRPAERSPCGAPVSRRAGCATA